MVCKSIPMRNDIIMKIKITIIRILSKNKIMKKVNFKFECIKYIKMSAPCTTDIHDCVQSQESHQNSSTEIKTDGFRQEDSCKFSNIWSFWYWEPHANYNDNSDDTCTCFDTVLLVHKLTPAQQQSRTRSINSTFSLFPIQRVGRDLVNFDNV